MCLSVREKEKKRKKKKEMGSLGGGEVARKMAMWLQPKIIGAIPSERWGHSACYHNGFVYVFGVRIHIYIIIIILII